MTVRETDKLFHHVPTSVSPSYCWLTPGSSHSTTCSPTCLSNQSPFAENHTAKSATAAPSAASVPAAAKTPAKGDSKASAAPPVRLVAPGQLFHILRKPPASLQEQFKLPPPPTKRQKHEEEKLFVAEEKDMDERGMFDAEKQNGDTNTSTANGEAAKGEAAKAEGAAAAAVPGPAVSHVVVRGADPNPRFLRIILSDALLADHSCKLYGKGIIDAMQLCA
ncbi:unnamed protein product [Closterium sp. NIES-65]|nr:unnamed protein product [Closterium sp. NIES-65]